MRFNLLTRRRPIFAREVSEPTLLALALAVVGFVLVLVICVVAVAFVSAFGYLWLTFAGVAAVLVWLGLTLRRKSSSAPSPMTGRQVWLSRIMISGRVLVIAVLASWLGLIAWQVVCPGGPAPEARSNPALIRVVTWNIHCGQDSGVPWQQFDWPNRKQALGSALGQVKPDILCVQEATPEQVAFLEETLPGHQRIGIGRDGENVGGEHCAIFFDRQRFKQLDGGTFWLEEPIDQPRVGSALDVKRICTWVRLRDSIGGRTFRVYNTHLYLTEAPRLTAAKIILDQIVSGDRTDSVLLTADFNASPTMPSRQLFIDFGLEDSAKRAGKTPGKSTFQLYGIGLWCIDGILVDKNWRVDTTQVVKVKPGNTFPSDHFGLLADLEWQK